MEKGKCRGCRADIVWAVTAKGKMQPLDVKPERRIVRPTLEPAGVEPKKLVAVAYDAVDGVHRAMVVDTWPIDTPSGEVIDAYMPHHAVCPKVGSFRGRK